MAITLNAQQTMWIVALLMLPGLGGMVVQWGVGIVWNIALLCTFCALTESVCAALRGQAMRASLGDGTWLITALIISACLPPSTSIGALALAAVGAIALTKHLYGGLGRNLFNPAMVGYALVLVCYPQLLNTWPSAQETDALSGATLLTEFRYHTGMTEFEFLQQNEFTGAWLAWLFAAGGGAMVLLKIIPWRLPVAACLGLGLAALVGSDQGSSVGHGSFEFHLFAGGFVFAAFFVVTDPITHPRTAAHQWIFGICVGLLTYLIRAYGVYPDGIAFAVLLANCLTPLLDRYASTREVNA